MRKLMALAIALVLSGATASWALVGLEDISFDGSLEVSGNAADNETDLGNDPDGAGALTENDKRGRTATRVRVGMNAQVTDGVKGRIEAIRGPRQYGTGATTVTTEEGLWAFHNAYVDIEDLWGHRIVLGRQYVGNPGDLVWNISPTDDDNLTNNSIDGILAQCRNLEWMHVDAFTGKSTEDDSITGAVSDTDRDDAGALATTGDVNLSSIDLMFPTLVPGGKINVGYLLGDDNNAQVRGDDNRLRTARIGINGGLSENMFTYRAEFFQNMGQFNGAGATGNLDYAGNAIDLGVGFNSEETSAGTFGLWLNYLMASGDDDITDNDDDSFHDFSVMGVNTSDRLLGEIFGKSNVLGGGTPLGQGIHTANAAAPNANTQGAGMSVLNIGGQFNPAFLANSAFRVDFYTFARAEDSVKTGAATTANVGDDFGTELDLAYLYDHSENVGIELGYAMLNPDDALKIQKGFALTGQDDAITKFYARTKIKWGGEE